MPGSHSIDISRLASMPSLAESLESCSAITGARIFVLDASGQVMAKSEAKKCSCPLCSEPPEHIQGGTATSADVSVAGEVIGRVCSCKAEPPAQEAVKWLAREMGMKALDQGDLDSLSEELLGMYEEINLVYDFSATVSSVFDESRIAKLVLERVINAIRADCGVAMLADREAGDFRVAASIGLPAASRESAGGLFDKAVCGRVASTGKAEVVDARDGVESADPLLMSAPLACSPLMANAAVIGVIALARKKGGGNFTAGDLKLLNAIASQMGIAVHNSRLIEEAKKQERLRRELEIAASIQASLLPGSPPDVETIEIAARSITAERVGGDYYGFFGGENGRFSLLIADVSGHSVAAALMAATLRSVARAAMLQGGSPSALVGRVNRMIYPDLENAAMLVSMFYADYDAKTSALGFANAGHNRPILCRGAESSLIDAPGLLLGVIPEHVFPEAKLQMQPGDLVFFYTDGLVEAEDDSREPYGEERLKEMVAQKASLPIEEFLDACLRDVQRHAGTQSLYDDVTMIAIRQK